MCTVSCPATAEDYSGTPMLEEVIVTAQKRGVESLQDVAMSAAVISSETIDLKQMVGMDDYLRTIPGIAFQEYGAGRSTIVIRGISADPQFGDGTTGVYLDEVPLSNLGDFGTSSPDVKLVDVNRIEILRGPQGTLYGSSSMGGTVRIITEKPRLDEFSGSVAGALSYTDGPGSENYDAQGVVNIPLKEDVFAIRAVAYYFDNSGYYENVAADDPGKIASAEATGGLVKNWDDVGSSTYSGGRITALWTPTDQLDLTLMYLGQKTEQEGNPYGDMDTGEFQQVRYSRYSTGRGEFNEDDLNVLNLQLEYDFGSMSLLSSSSWNDYKNIEDWDVGKFWTFAYEEDAPIFLRNTTDTDSFVQEARLDSQWDHPINFMAGVYYEDWSATWNQLLEWDGDPAYDPFAGDLLVMSNGATSGSQLAFFGELYWDITDTLTATAGIRHFDYKSTLDFTGDGYFNGGPVAETLSSAEDGNTYKLNVSYQPNEQSLYYAQWSQGFRMGEPQTQIPDNCDADGDGLVDGVGLPAPDQIDSDYLDSWEIGSKLSFMNNRVDLRAAVFYNQWTGIPIYIAIDSCGYFVAFNAGSAETRGIELEGSAQLSEHWRLDFSAGYLKGELTADAPGLGVDGDRLPGSPNYTATLGLQYDFLIGKHNSFLRGDLATVGGYYNNLQQEGREAGDYTTLNLSMGVQLNHWDLQVFMQNVTNSSAATWVSPFTEYGSVYRLRPRTTGFSLRYAF